MADISPASVITPNSNTAAVRYLRARFFDRDMAALLLADPDAAEMDREAIGVDRGEPFQVSDRCHCLVPRNAEVRHFALPGGILIRVHEEAHHRLLPALRAGDGDPGGPGRIEPRLRQVGAVVGAVPHEGVAIDTGAAL